MLSRSALYLISLGICVTSCKDDPKNDAHGNDAGVAPTCDAGTCALACTLSPLSCPTDAWPSDWKQYESELLTLINTQRASAQNCGGVTYPAVAALAGDDALSTAARFHSLGMLRVGFFSHDWPDKPEYKTWKTFRDRATLVDRKGAVENIAVGYPTPQATVDGWMKSAEHCKNIMSATTYKAGLGYAKRGPGDAAADNKVLWPQYWTFLGGD